MSQLHFLLGREVSIGTVLVLGTIPVLWNSNNLLRFRFRFRIRLQIQNLAFLLLGAALFIRMSASHFDF
jgi:hypothetical protein